MPEYIRITPEYDSDDPDVVHLVTNLTLHQGASDEVYASAEEGDIGSPLAQLLFQIEGIQALTITEDTFIITRYPDAEWHILIDEISTAVKDFYL